MIVEGIPQIIRKMDRLTDSVKRKVLRKGVRAGGAVQLKATKALAPKGATGLLGRSMTQVIRSYASKGVFMSLVGQQKNKHFSEKSKSVARRKAKFGGGISGSGRVVPIHLVNDPTKPHAIVSRRVLRFRGGGGLVFSKRVRHPGTAGTRFIQLAESSSAAASRRATEAKIEAETAAEVAKL